MRPEPARPAIPTDLALAHLEGDALQDAAPGESRDRQRDLTWLAMAPAVHIVNVAADHHAHQAVWIEVTSGRRGDDPPVLHHGHAVGDLEDFVEAMRDVDEGDTIRGQAADDVEEALQLGIAQDRGGLVEHDDPRIARERLGDLDHLPPRHAEVADDRPRVELEAEPLGERRRLVHHPPPVDDAAAVSRQSSHEDVLGRREVDRERGLLVDDRDPAIEHVVR